MTESRLKLLATMLLTVGHTLHLLWRRNWHARYQSRERISKTRLASVIGPFTRARWLPFAHAMERHGERWLWNRPTLVARASKLHRAQRFQPTIQPRLTLNFHKALIQLRRKHPSLHAGDIQLIPVENKTYWFIYAVYPKKPAWSSQFLNGNPTI